MFCSLPLDQFKEIKETRKHENYVNRFNTILKTLEIHRQKVHPSSLEIVWQSSISKLKKNFSVWHPKWLGKREELFSAFIVVIKSLCCRLNAKLYGIIWWMKRGQEEGDHPTWLLNNRVVSGILTVKLARLHSNYCSQILGKSAQASADLLWHLLSLGVEVASVPATDSSLRLGLQERVFPQVHLRNRLVFGLGFNRKTSIWWRLKTQVALGLQQWRYVTVLSGLACSSRTSAKQSSRAVLALLQLLSSSSWCPQAPWQSSGWSWTLLLAILPSTQRRGLARLQIHEHPQSLKKCYQAV